MLTNSLSSAGAVWTEVLRAILLPGFSLIWTVLFGVFMVACFSRNASPFSKSAFDPALPFMKRFEVLRLLLLLLIQAVGYAISYLTGKYLVTALIWLAAYWLFTRKQPGIFNKPKTLTAVLSILIAAAAVCTLIESLLLRDMTDTALDMGSVLAYLEYLEVSQRVNAILSFVCNAVIGCTMICFHIHAASGSADENKTDQ